MNEIVNMEKNTAPLTAEETTLLYTLSTKQIVGLISKMYNNIKNDMSEFQSSIKSDFATLQAQTLMSTDSLKDAIDSIKSSYVGISPEAQADSERWIQDIYSKVESVASRQRTISGRVVGRVYTTMLSNYGININNEYSKFRKVRPGSKLVMCSVSPMLRSKFEQALLEVAVEELKRR